MTTPCPSTPELRGLVDGSLSDSEADSLQLHIESCETCQKGIQEIVADGDFWKSAARNLSDDETDGPGLDRIVEELQQQSPEDAEEMGEAIELKLSFIDPPTEPGTIGQLKHYDILRVAGRGGMGIVLKAFDRTLRRVVAVKMLAPHLAGNGQARQRFVREGRSAAGICHEHVVTIHAVEESPPFIVMQYVKGETLEARIHRNGSLELREAVRIAKQIAQGLAAAHSQGVIHRDIKPANILLENGVARVRITDFGLARAVDDASLTQSGVVAGTPQYMAPEQANGDAVDERADLFSLGSVLYTMLAGHAPFRATTTMGVLKRLCDHNARPIREINPDVPDWLVVMINRLHAKRPADRYQSAQEVAEVLERGLAAMQNGAAPTVDLPKSEPTTGESPEHSQVQSSSSLEAVGSSQRNVTIEQQSMPRWLMLPIPIWLIAVPLIVVAFGPLGRFPAEISAMLIIGLSVLGLLFAGLKPFWSERETNSDVESASHSPPTVDLKRLVAMCLFRPMPQWIVFVIVGICVTPFAPSASVLAAILAAVWLVAKRLVPDRWKPQQEERTVSGQSAIDADTEIRYDNFFLVRLVRRAFEVAPRSFGGCFTWLLLWLAPAFVWASAFFYQEDRIHRGVSSRRIDEIDFEILLVAFGVCATWMLVGLMWFRRRRSDGSVLFARRARWSGVLGTLGLAGIFAVCGYETWKSDVYLRALGNQAPRVPNILWDEPVAAPVARHTTLRVEFEVTADEMEVLIDFPDERVVKLTPSHQGIMVQLSEPPGTYKWRAIYNGVHVAAGEVTLTVDQPAMIKVPRPELARLIGGRWESDPKKDGFDDGSMDNSGSDLQVEIEFEGDLATFAVLAVRESGQVDRSQFRVRIDESVMPALIDLSTPDGQQLTGIVSFQAGRKSQLQRQGSHIMSPLAPFNSETPMLEESIDGGSEYEGSGSPTSAFNMGSGGASVAKRSEPDRLLLCLTDGSGLRPWEFQADESRGHMLFTMVRSRETGSLREKLALDPVQLGTSHDLIQDSVKGWAKRLKIDTTGTNSAGLELVLVPPAAYHLVDLPHLAYLRRELPEPESIRDSIQKDPSFKYKTPTEFKDLKPISKRSKFISYPFVMSRHPVTMDQFQNFVDETGYVTDAERGTPLPPTASSDDNEVSDNPKTEPAVATENKGGWHRQNRLFNWTDGLSWKSSIRTDDAKPDRPVSVISWHDATEFCKWLSEKEGRQYRLPTNGEWTAVMQLGAARKPLPATNSDEPMISDYYGWFDENSRHPLGIVQEDDTFAEWTQDAQYGTGRDRMVLVHREISADSVRFYLGAQFTADKAFRASGVGFRVVAELQALAVDQSEKPTAESPD